MTWRQGSRGAQRSHLGGWPDATRAWPSSRPSRAGTGLAAHLVARRARSSHQVIVLEPVRGGLAPPPGATGQTALASRTELWQLKEEVGLDHYEGRGWQGWHHHVTLVCLACAFLLGERQRYRKLRSRPCRRDAAVYRWSSCAASAFAPPAVGLYAVEAREVIT